MANLTSEQYIELSKKLPESLKYAIFSEQTANTNFKIFDENDLDFDMFPRVAKVIGDVLFGLILPSDLGQELEKELGLAPAVAQNIAQMADKMIFTPIKDDLEAFRNGATLTDEIEENVENNEIVEDIGLNTEEQTISKNKKSTTLKRVVKKEDSKLPEKPITPSKQKSVSSDQYKEKI